MPSCHSLDTHFHFVTPRSTCFSGDDKAVPPPAEANKSSVAEKADVTEAEVEAEVAPEDVPLSSEETAVLKLLGDCTHAWNVLDKKPHALKLGRQALERIKGPGIRPRMVAEVRVDWGCEWALNACPSFPD